MKIAQTKTTKLVITGTLALDPITVFTEDFGPGKGILTLHCYGRAWSSYWGAMSGNTVRHFVARANAGYVVDNLVSGMAHRVQDASNHEDAYLTRIVVAVQAAFRELETPAKRLAKLQRIEHANALIKVISDHGRRFFWNEKDQRIARLELDPRGRVWFHDDYRAARIYTHDTGGRWRGFSHGGTLRSLVIAMRDYVTKGEQIPRWRIATINLYGGDEGENIWGYDKAAAEATRAAAFTLPIIEPDRTASSVLP